MWIHGRRRGGAKDLSKHLQKTEENESVAVCEINGFSFGDLTGDNLDKAIKEMEIIGYGKGDKRSLYHAIVAPAYGETLNAAQRKFMIDYYAEHMGFKGHQRAVVEHWKHGKQHFHLVFNIIDPITGKTHELKWTKQKEWRISRGLEEIFGHNTPSPKGKSARTWEMQRGKRTGIDPRKMRKEVTALFKSCQSAEEFVIALDKAGYRLTLGKRNQLVLVDKFGDTHGLMRRIEGKTVADLRRKFTGIEKLSFQKHDDLVKAGRPVKGQKTGTEQLFEPINPQTVHEDVQKAYRASNTGVEFFAKLNKAGYSLGRGLKGFAVIDSNGDRHDINKLLGQTATKGLKEKFPDLAPIRPRPASEIIRRIKAQRSKQSKNTKTSFKSFARANRGGSGASPLTQQFSFASKELALFAGAKGLPRSHKSSEPARKAKLPISTLRTKNTQERKVTPHREDIGGDDISFGRAESAYQEELDKWQGLIEATASDPALSKDQRFAGVKALRLRQQVAAKGVRQRVLDEEKASAKAFRRARKILFGAPKREPRQ